MKRVGNVTLQIECDICGKTNIVTLSNKEWEDGFWISPYSNELIDCTPFVNITCPSCGNCKDVCLY